MERPSLLADITEPKARLDGMQDRTRVEVEGWER